MTTAPYPTDAPRTPALAALIAYLDTFPAERMDVLTELFADDAIVEFPYAPAGMLPARVAGKDAIRAYYKDTPASFRQWKVAITRVFDTVDRDVVVAEWSATATIARTGKRYDQRYIGVTQVRDGKIVLHREYWNPSVVLEAFGDPGYLGETFNTSG